MSELYSSSSIHSFTLNAFQLIRPVGDCPVGDCPVGDCPVGDCPVGECPCTMLRAHEWGSLTHVHS